jgi:hypothetical protein
VGKRQMYIPDQILQVVDRDGLVWDRFGWGSGIWDCEKWPESFQDTSKFISERGPVSW